MSSKKFVFFLCMYKMYTFSTNTWSKIDVETIKYNGKKWINEKDLEKPLGYKNLVGNKTQYYSNEFRKRRYEKRDCEDCQTCRKVIAEDLAIHSILDIKTVKAGELKIKFGFNQLDPIMIKQQEIGLRSRKLFSNEEIIEDFSALNYLIDFYFPKYKVAIEVDKLGHKDRDQTKENKRQKDLKEYLDCKFIRINPDEKNFDIYDGFKKTLTFINELKQRQTKNFLIGDLTKRLLELELKSNHSIKSKCLK